MGVIRSLFLRRRQIGWRLGVCRLVPVHYSKHDVPWAIVTGAGAGIGRAFAITLAQEGFSVVLVDRDSTALATVAHTATMFGVNTLVVQADATDPLAHEIITQRIVEDDRDIQPSLLINNLGMSTSAPTRVDQYSCADIDRLLNANARFTVLLTQSLLPHLLVQPKGGRAGVLFISSAASLVPPPYCAIYAATKAFVNTFCRGLAAETAGAGWPLDSVVIAPGYVNCGNTPRWVGSGKISSASPQAIADAGLALLANASNAGVVRPFWTDQLLDILVYLLPDSFLSSVIYKRHFKQRADCLHTHE